MAEAVISIGVETIRDLLVRAGGSLFGLSDQVEEVQEELRQMQCFLNDADRRQHESDCIRYWLRRARYLGHRIENLLEHYAIKVACREGEGILNQAKGFTFICMPCKFNAHYKVASEIAEIEKEISVLTQSMRNYGIRAIIEGESSNTAEESECFQRQTFPHEVEEHFVGMKDDINQLVSIITGEDRLQKVISIYGMGGLGKTTLAKKIWNHRHVQQCFEAFAWVTVTQKCQPTSILQSILKQLIPDRSWEEIKNMRYRELVEELYKVQKGKKCLIILDDIWKVTDWENICHAFPSVQARSKVLITTRKKNVAGVGFCHELNLLTEDEGWELLKTKAFTEKRLDISDSKNGQRLEDMGRTMIRKCGCLPLAISVLGGVLSKKESLSDWERVNKDLDSYLRRGEGIEEKVAVAEILALSYNDLPFHLKPCFLYIGHLQENKNIDVETLYLIWMAEGMVSSKDQGKEETPVDVAERYLSELACRCMVQVQVKESSPNRMFESCRLHDLLRDLCLEMGKQEEFMNVMKFQGGKFHSSDPSAYRLAVYMVRDMDGNARTNITKEATQKLRSLLFYGVHSRYQRITLAEDMLCHLKVFKYLRVLSFEQCSFPDTKSLSTIGKLFHLRFLSFKGCILFELPSCVGNLPWLEILDLRVPLLVGWIKIPNVLWKLKQLRHLYLPDRQYVPKEAGRLRLHGLDKLETLVGFHTAHHEITDITGLTSLRVFSADVWDSAGMSSISDHIDVSWPNLRETSLSITYEWFISTEGSNITRKAFMFLRLHSLELMGPIGKLPTYSATIFPSLVKLTLWRSQIEADSMETLEQLPNLQKLFLYDAFAGKDLIFHATGFPSLRYLRLCYLKNLETWKIDEGAAPNLSRLEISECEKLEMIPDGLRFITSLKEVKIFCMCKEFQGRVQVAICHVPRVHISDDPLFYHEHSQQTEVLLDP